MVSHSVFGIHDRPDYKRDDVADLRFRALVSSADWAMLPAAVQTRFSKRLNEGASAVYIGRVTAIQYSRLGFILAQALRIVGAPLPTIKRGGVATVVTVTEDQTSGGQIWTRMYGRTRGFPQVIHSVKRFSGPTGLEEYIGCGIGMALAISVEGSALVFRSQHYFFEVNFVGTRRYRLKIPGGLTPGHITVKHFETRPGAFLFTLELSHAVFGTLVRQDALYHQEML